LKASAVSSRLVPVLLIGILVVAGLVYIGTSSGIARATTTSTATVTATAVPNSNPSGSTDCNNATGPGSYVGSQNLSGGLPLVVGNSLYQCERVLVIPPGSTGTLVVLYQTDLGAVSPPSDGGSETANFTASVLAPIFSPILAIPELPPTYTNATGVTITPSIASVNVTALGNANSFDVTYTIDISSGVRGFFVLQYLDACPTMIPLAVGYTASQLNASSFAYYQPFLQACTGLGMLPGGALMSVSGIQMAWMIQTIQPQQTAPDSAS
jgi:hypothetical protein